MEFHSANLDRVYDWLDSHMEAILYFIGGGLLGLISTKARRKAETEGIVQATMSKLMDDVRKHKDDMEQDAKEEKEELRARIKELKVKSEFLKKEIRILKNKLAEK